MAAPDEQAFEDAICNALIDHGGYDTIKVGNAADRQDDFSPTLALDTHELTKFISATQTDEFDRFASAFGDMNEAQRAFTDRLTKELDRRGTIDVLRRGITVVGLDKIDFTLAYFRPASGLNPELEANYRANQLTVIRQLPFNPNSTETIDLGLFINGIPVATAELKNHLTGQNAEHAMAQYRSRDHRHPVIRRAIVHFAIDTEQAFTTTKLDGEDTRFLPFNRGNGDHAGNPAPTPADGYGYRTGYLWHQVWQRDAWLDLMARFVLSVKDQGNTTTLFPRYHQWRAVNRLVDAARTDGPGHSYLIQHSAGSGKSNTIAWLAHRLSSLHGADDTPVFDKVVVLTDRLVLDRQLQDTIYQFEHTHGVISKIDEHSRQLAEALAGEQARIIITTIQKFPYVMEHVESLKQRNYAVLIDEAHSSQTGESAKEMKRVLGGGDLDSPTTITELQRAEAEAAAHSVESADPLQDLLAEEVSTRGRQSNLSFFAFTATPKARTLEIFGHKNHQGKFAPFDLYSMRQAIEERFIHDVLLNFTTYDTAFKLNKAITDDPEMDKKRTSAAIARFVALHPDNLSQRAEIIIEHFRSHVAHQVGGHGKAMVVTASRLHALRYKQALDTYCRTHGIGDVGVLCAFSGSLSEDGGMGGTIEHTESSVNGFPDSETPSRFDTDEWQILVVAEKYQTGFDQPKLYAMYVDKTLTGLAAVQTLSRLNRTHPLKTGTFVLDFRNTVESIQASFSDWYTETHSTPTDPHILYDTHAEVLHFDVLRDNEIEVMVELLLTDPKKNHERISNIMQPAVDRFGALDNDQQDAFRDAITRFTRVYSFLSQVVSFTDTKLERDYLFCRNLARLIPTEPVAGVDLGDKVELTHLKMEQTWSGDASLDDEANAGDLTVLPGGAGARRTVDKVPLSAIVNDLNERFSIGISENDLLLRSQVDRDLIDDVDIQQQALANDIDTFSTDLDKKWQSKLLGRLDTNEKFAYQLIDNEELREHLLNISIPEIHARARVARQRTAPITDLIGPDGETRTLEYKSTMRWDVNKGHKAPYIEDAIVKTVAGFANSDYGGTLIVGVTDHGDIYGLEADYATFSKRGQRGDRDLWGQHLSNLLDRLGPSAAALVDWEFFTIDGDDVCRVNIDPSNHPVYDTKGDTRAFWWRTPVSTERIDDPAELDHLIARRWPT